MLLRINRKGGYESYLAPAGQGTALTTVGQKLAVLNETPLSLATLRQKGVAVFDVIIAIGIILLLTAGVIVFALSGNTAQAENDVLNEVGAIQTVVQTLYAGQPNYNGLNTAQIAGSNQLATKWIVNSTTLGSAYGAVTLTSASPYTSYNIAIANVSQAACVSLATKDIGTSSETVYVAGTNTNANATGSLTPAAAQTACSSGAVNTVTWNFSN